MMSELDLALVNALQISPRASWVQLARVLEVDASTVARHWARLHERGAAWVTAQPLTGTDSTLAFVEISVEPGRSLDVAAELAADPQAMTIDVAAGARDLLVTAVCPDLVSLADYLLERIARVPHVARVQSHILVRAYTEASRWRLRVLSPGQERQLLETVATPSPAAGGRPTGDFDLRLIAALSQDGRMSPGALAAAVGSSESTVRRRLNALVGSGALKLRCELARGLTEWPVSSWFFLRVPSDRIDDAGHVLARVPEVRAVLAAAGPFNLLVAVWLRSVADGQLFETQLMRRLPRVEVVDRSVVMRPFKLLGRLLDPHGFAIGVVPLDLVGGQP